ncbi:hypothetical protein [Halobacteriovorax sp.]|uniref:hypothetical protein n=1 Tax=Halobacteriovorax sp. TaxID=2020862 RepID=UPI00356A8B05
MKKKIAIVFIFTFILNLSNSFAFPYSTSNEIQVYSEVPDDFLSAEAKECIKRANKTGVMSQLSQNLGCSNFVTAEKVCGCVNLRFDQTKVQEFVNSSEVTEMNTLMGNVRSLDEDKIKPVFMFSSGVSTLNQIYDQMGLSGCSMDQNDPYLSKIYDVYARNRSIDLEDNKLTQDEKDIQHSLFNSKLKDLGRYPNDEDLIEISRSVSKDSGNQFFLDTQLTTSISTTNENLYVVNNIKATIVNDYVSMHLKDIKSGVPPEEFKVKDIEREGCKELMSYVSVVKDKDIQEKIESNFSTFFPDSFIDKGGTPDEKIEKREVVENAIVTLKSYFGMTGTPEYKKDIFYCSKYNEFKKRSEEMSKNNELKNAMAELEHLKENVLVGMLAMSGSTEAPEIKVIREQIKVLEEEIKAKFEFSDESLKYAYMGLKIWKIDQGVESRVSDDGVITFHKVDPNTSTQTLVQKVTNKRNIIERSRISFVSRNNLKDPMIASSNFNSKVSNAIVKPINRKEVSVSSYTPKVKEANITNNDNYFNRSNISATPNRDINQLKNNINQNISFGRDEVSSQDPLEDYISERLSKLKKDKVDTQKALSDELTSTKESLELAKLREELRSQSAEIEKLTNKKEDVSVVANNSSTNIESTPSNFSSPLASALNKSFIDNTSEDTTVRQVDDVSTGRNIATASSFIPGVDQSPVSNGGSNTSSSAPSSSISLTEDSSSVSGISLTSLKNIGDDVQVVDNSVLGEISPIVVDASFSELSEEEKRVKIEELLETVVDDEVYIEFPDGKVLKFSKKDELEKSKKPTKIAKKAEEIKKRDTFSYDKLKEIIDNTKE